MVVGFMRKHPLAIVLALGGGVIVATLLTMVNGDLLRSQVAIQNYEQYDEQSEVCQQIDDALLQLDTEYQMVNAELQEHERLAEEKRAKLREISGDQSQLRSELIELQCDLLTASIQAMASVSMTAETEDGIVIQDGNTYDTGIPVSDGDYGFILP